MTIEIGYDAQASCYVGREPTREVLSAGTTWQRAIAATVSAVGMWDRLTATSILCGCRPTYICPKHQVKR